MYTPVGRGSNGHFWRNLSGVYRKKTPTKENSVNLLVAPEGLLVFPTSFPHASLRDPPTEQLSWYGEILELWKRRGRVERGDIFTYSVINDLLIISISCYS